jgi:hypothetical protein
VKRGWLVVSALSLSTLSCSGDRSHGLAATKPTGGPRVVYDIERRPLPELPLPTDTATRLDPTSPTGRRINVSLLADTHFESTLRRDFDKLDGFGVFAPITVSFDRPLDPLAVKALHADDDFRNDAVFLLNVDPSCKRYGEEIALDIGRGRFPVLMANHGDPKADPKDNADGNRLFEFDPAGAYNDVLFEERNEDKNGNGLLDPGEDLDDDGHLDVANLDDPAACDGKELGTLEWDRCIADHLMTHYERESNTLIMRPVWPLEQRCTHAVVLTKRLVGADGRPVESPLPAVNPRDQTKALGPVPGLLTRYGLTIDDVAFAWTFTTGSMTQVVEALRKGLYGAGPFARLASEFPIDSLTPTPITDSAGNPAFVTSGGCSAEAMDVYYQKGLQEYPPNMCPYTADNAALGGFVWGTYDTPNFMVDKSGRTDPARSGKLMSDPDYLRYPNDTDEEFDVDAERGTATYGRAKVTWWCALPKKRDNGCTPGNPDGKPFCEPFPTVLYAHGYGSQRGEIAEFFGRQVSMGIASCGIDSFGHGGNAYLQSKKLSVATGILSAYHVPGFEQTLFAGRDRDLNNDGSSDPGGDFYSANLFHTRDNLRQATVEFMQLVRILRGLDGQKLAKDGKVLGDFDGDGAPDIGGPKNTIALWGISLGGLITGVLAGAEPAVDSVVTISGGAGLTDITVRSTVSGLPTAVFLPVVGPFVAGYRNDDGNAKPYDDGAVTLGFLAGDVVDRVRVDFATVKGIAPGDTVELVNLDKGFHRTVTVGPRGTFRVAVAADALTAMEKRPVLGLVDEPATDPIRVDDTTMLGDRFAVRARDPSGAPKKLTVVDTGEVVDEVRTFYKEATFQGALYPKGAPLVTLQRGLAYRRNSPDFRKFLGLAQTAIDPVDSAVWSQFYYEEALDASYDPAATPGRKHVMVVPTAGDMVVPANVAMTQARTAGLLGSWKRDPSIAPEYGWRALFVPDPRYGKSKDRMLVDSWAMENLHRLGRYPDNAKNPFVNYDVDDLSDGRTVFPCSEFPCVGAAGMDDEFHVPGPGLGKGLRATHVRGDGSFDGMRIPYLSPHGQHGLNDAQAVRTFDGDAHGVNLVSLYMRSRGRTIELSPDCHCSASSLVTHSLDGKPIEFSDEPPCTNDGGMEKVKLCSAACQQTLDLRTEPKRSCAWCQRRPDSRCAPTAPTSRSPRPSATAGTRGPGRVCAARLSRRSRSTLSEPRTPRRSWSSPDFASAVRSARSACSTSPSSSMPSRASSPATPRRSARASTTRCCVTGRTRSSRSAWSTCGRRSRRSRCPSVSCASVAWPIRGAPGWSATPAPASPTSVIVATATCRIASPSVPSRCSERRLRRRCASSRCSSPSMRSGVTRTPIGRAAIARTPGRSARAPRPAVALSECWGRIARSAIAPMRIAPITRTRTSARAPSMPTAGSWSRGRTTCEVCRSRARRCSFPARRRARTSTSRRTARGSGRSAPSRARSTKTRASSSGCGSKRATRPATTIRTTTPCGRSRSTPTTRWGSCCSIR